MNNKFKHVLQFLIFLIVVMFVIPSIYVSIRSSDPEFCLSCHYEKPYYKSWKESNHSDISCIECHPNLRTRMPVYFFKNFWGIYSMTPHANVETETCLKCHEKDKLFSDNKKLVDKKSFSHKTHLSESLRGVTLRCSSCHSHIVQGNHNTVEETVCFNCHFKGASPTDSITGCESCHGTPKETVSRHGFSFSHEKYLKLGVSCGECHTQITEGAGKLVSGVCHKCHVEPPVQPEHEKLHEIHVKLNGVDCFECHSTIKHGNIKMVKTFDVKCDDCHSSLHNPQKALYMGVGGKGIEDYPSRMFAAQVTCDGCHTKTNVIQKDSFSNQTTQYQNPQTCVTCHQPGFDSLLYDWQKGFKNILSYVGNRIDKVSKSPKTTTLPGKEILKTAKHNYDLVKSGKAAHNIEYGIKLMKYTVDELDNINKQSIQERPLPLRTEDSYCAGMCHGKLGMPENILFDDSVDFPHPKHMEIKGVTCKNCHSTEHHGITTLKLENCSSCHHQELSNVEERCTTCHKKEVKFMDGIVQGLESGDSDPMVGQVSCNECHVVTEGEKVTLALIKEKCSECHDEDYGTMLDEWTTSGIEKSTNLVKMVKELETLAETKTDISKNDAKTVEANFKKLKIAAEIFTSKRFYHNPEYANTIYEQAEGYYNNIKELLK